jgi:hypothetical protein
MLIYENDVCEDYATHAILSAMSLFFHNQYIDDLSCLILAGSSCLSLPCLPIEIIGKMEVFS